MRGHYKLAPTGSTLASGAFHGVNQVNCLLLACATNFYSGHKPATHLRVFSTAPDKAALVLAIKIGTDHTGGLSRWHSRQGGGN